MNAIKIFKQSWCYFYKNKYGFLIGTSILHFTMSIFGVNALFWAFKLILLFSNQENLTKDNFYLLFSNPLSFLFCAIYVLLVAFLTFIEFFVLVTFINSRKDSESFSLKRVFSKAFLKMRSLLSFQIFFFGEISKTPAGLIMCIVLVVIIFYINFRLIFTLPRTILKDEPLSKSIKASWKDTHKKMAQILIPIGIFEIIFLAATLIFMLITVTLLGGLKEILGFLIAQTVLQTIFDAAFFALSVLTKISIVIVLLEILDSKNLKNNPKPAQQKKHSKTFALLMIALLMGATFTNGIQIYYRKVDTKILKIAHRGNVHGGVENSLEALESAKKIGADYAELDIQLTRDNHFVVMHDYNLQRLTGRNARVRDLTLDEIKTLTIRENNFESRIPTFEEYVNKAKKINIKLLVEIKPSGDEPEDFAEMFIKKFRKLGVEKTFKVMSLDLDLMRKIERIDPAIETGFVIPIQFGDFDDSKIDFYVIEDFSYRSGLAFKAHKKHRKIFVWTLNTQSEISRYLQEPIDGIISDEIQMIEDIEKEDRSKEPILKSFVRLLKLRF